MLPLPKLLPLFIALAAVAQVPSEVEKDKKMLQGQWAVVSMVQGGKEIPGLKEEKMTFTFQGDKLIVKLGDKVMNEGICTIDPGKAPRTIDLNDKRDTIQGIYEFKENEVKLCMGGRGKDRPKDFTALPGTDQSVVTLKRIK